MGMGDFLMSDHDPIETAWRIHGAQVDWIGKVDSKASFALAIESAVLVSVAGASQDGPLSHLSGFWELALYRGGIICLIVGVLLAITVVAPRIRSGHPDEEVKKKHFIHFGHLRHWEPQELARALQDADLLAVLCDQVVIMAQIAWSKHLRVQASLAAGVAGGALIGLTATINGG